MDHQTIATYNALAKEYDEETIDFWDLFPKTFINKFIELSGTSILDIGSGPGRDGLLLQAAGKDVTCIDASEEMIKLSSSRGLKSIQADFNSLPIEDSSVDAVWCYTTLLHTSKKAIDTPLSEIARVLQPSGIFAVGLIEGTTEEYKKSSGVQLLRLFSFYQKEEFIQIAQQHGFELVYFEEFMPRSKNYLNFIFKKI
ncbi:MAG: hypothetical protein RL094_788 [Candidatus Parcubacteria bacterium]|jgi:ubiquinone/menaquinone biosynthesis C-methylase UbiE